MSQHAELEISRIFEHFRPMHEMFLWFSNNFIFGFSSSYFYFKLFNFWTFSFLICVSFNVFTSVFFQIFHFLFFFERIHSQLVNLFINFAVFQLQYSSLLLIGKIRLGKWCWKNWDGENKKNDVPGGERLRWGFVCFGKLMFHVRIHEKRFLHAVLRKIGTKMLSRLFERNCRRYPRKKSCCVE